jgi:GMP synthase (glutamine-hydrolysing)
MPQDMHQHDTIVVLDYGSQYSQLIARRVREAEVYCELFSWRTAAETIMALNPKGFILSGGPNSVYDDGAPTLPDYVLTSGVPVLGICYGMQLLSYKLGGAVGHSPKREYGPPRWKLMSLIIRSFTPGSQTQKPGWPTHKRH